MPRQIQICTTPKDDLLFIEYLRNNFDCALFQSFASTEEAVWVKDLADLHDAYDTIKIWNRDFVWKPQYSTTSREQLVYISNTSHAPVIRLERSNWETRQHGRIYWSKEISEIPEYDLIYFEKFYNKLAQWFQKNAWGKVKRDDTNVYYMKHAWKRFMEEN
jgi:hypothetical protein